MRLPFEWDDRFDGPGRQPRPTGGTAHEMTSVSTTQLSGIAAWWSAFSPPLPHGCYELVSRLVLRPEVAEQFVEASDRRLFLVSHWGMLTLRRREKHLARNRRRQHVTGLCLQRGG